MIESFFLTESEVGEEVEESKWQNRIAFRFDQIVSFASTAMEDKRRRSTEEGTSCNTSPDSGIGHGDPPPPSISVIENRSSHIPQICSSPPKSPRILVTPNIKTSPNSESPPLEPPGELSVPLRTPSPCSLPPPSPPGAATLPPLPVAQVPLKYQRQEKPSGHASHHFKKKFFHREQWSGWPTEPAERPHKGKFRPKGKDWDWSAGGPGGGTPSAGREEWEERPSHPM